MSHIRNKAHDVVIAIMSQWNNIVKANCTPVKGTIPFCYTEQYIKETAEKIKAPTLIRGFEFYTEIMSGVLHLHIKFNCRSVKVRTVLNLKSSVYKAEQFLEQLSDIHPQDSDEPRKEFY